VADTYGAWAYSSLGAKSIRILHVSNDYGQTNAGAFKARFEKLGGSVRTVRAFPQGESDFRNVITELRSSGPSDAVLIVAYPDEYRGIFREIGSQPLDATLLATDTFYAPELLARIGPGAEGVCCAAASKPDDDYAPRAEFVRRYGDRFKGADGKPRIPGLVSDTAYDALHLIADGIRDTDGSPVAVSDWLLKLRRYGGAVGPTQFSSQGDFEGGLAVYRVRQGAFVKVTN
jgi:branched-chain amino acid transport system substrate-binding protein